MQLDNQLTMYFDCREVRESMLVSGFVASIYLFQF